MTINNEPPENTSTIYQDEKHTDFVHSIDHDVETDEEYSPELQAAEKSLLRKLDFIHVMPCVAILNFLQV